MGILSLGKHGSVSRFSGSVEGKLLDPVGSKEWSSGHLPWGGVCGYACEHACVHACLLRAMKDSGFNCVVPGARHTGTVDTEPQKRPDEVAGRVGSWHLVLRPQPLLISCLISMTVLSVCLWLPCSCIQHVS